MGGQGAGNTKNMPAIIFLHGYMGFGRPGWVPAALGYFRGITSARLGIGTPCYFPHSCTFGPLEKRARRIARYIESVPEQDIYLVCHSMGGLDARYLIQHLDPEGRIKKLVTVATPHAGTWLADWALTTNGPLQWAGQLLTRNALRDLGRETGARRDQEFPLPDSVELYSYSSARPAEEVPLFVRPLARILQQQEGDNDVLVSTASATWQGFQRQLRADHFELVGWNFGFSRKAVERPFDHVALYREIVHQVLGVE